MLRVKRTKIGGKWIRPKKRLLIYERDGMMCVYCGKHLKPGKRCTLDHVVPLSLGGSNHSSNLVTCCLWCNVAKGCTDAYDYARNDIVRERIFNAANTPLRGYREPSGPKRKGQDRGSRT